MGAPIPKVLSSDLRISASSERKVDKLPAGQPKSWRQKERTSFEFMWMVVDFTKTVMTTDSGA